MPAPLSVDLRQRIMAAYAAKEGSQRQLAERFKVSLSFVRDLMRHYRARALCNRNRMEASHCQVGQRAVAHR
jgi:transposase